MRAPQQQCVHFRLPERRQQPLGQHVDLVAGRLTPLHELDEAGAGSARELQAGRQPGRRPLVGAGGDGAHGADHTDAPALGDHGDRSHTGLDHAHHGHAEGALQLGQRRGRRRGVAGHHQELDTVVVDQVAGDLQGEAAHLVQGAGTVRIAAGVADVHQALGREQVDHRPGHGQPAEAGVEHADRPVVHPGRVRPFHRALPLPHTCR